MPDDELRRAIRERAYLEGDFVLRSGQALDVLPRQVPVRDAARPARARSAARIAAAVAEAEPDAVSARRPRARCRAARGGRLARLAPAVPHRPRGRRRSTGRPTASRAVLPGERVCLVEDVVTTGGAAVEAVQAPARGRARVRDGGLRRRSRGRRGGRAGTRRVRLRPSFAPPRFSKPENPRKIRMVERIRCGCYAATML